MKIFVAGTFDHFHVGHQWLLWQACLRSQECVVVLARDESVKRIKGFFPSHNEAQRLARVQQENLPHTKVILGKKGGDFLQIVKEENPDLILLGYDQNCPDRLQESFLVERLSAYHPHIFKSSYFRSVRGIGFGTDKQG